MEPSSSSSSICENKQQEEEKVEEWEDFEQALARLWSLSSALNQANLRKLSLQQKLQSHIQVSFSAIDVVFLYNLLIHQNFKCQGSKLLKC